jgi:tRNA(adenine34) deaminase
MVQPIRQAPPCPFEKRFPSQLVRNDEFYLWLAYNQAIDAWRADEVPIGAVIELGGEVVASAHNQRDSTRDPTAHAEIIALGQAARAIGDWRLNDATLYVTKEPCPMCSGAALMSRVKRVVFAISDPKMGCLGGATDLNALPQMNHRCEITRGLLEQPCLELLQGYFSLKRQET